MPQAITNNATIEYQYETANNTVSLETRTNYVTTNITQNCINVLKTSNKDHFGPNEKITYNLFISNNSNSTIYNVEILESLSEFTEYIQNSSSITLSNGETIPIKDANNTTSNELPTVGYIIEENASSKNVFGFKLNNIGSNETILVSFSTQIKENDNLSETISNSATLYYKSTPESTSRLSIRSNTNTINKAYALLSAVKSVDKSNAFCGDPLVYTIKISNHGNVNATNVHIVDQLPANFELTNVDLVIADLPYKIGYRVDENNTLTIPSSENEKGFCIPATSDDNILTISGVVNC